MTEPRDEIDEWLETPVQPLLPPPGSYERIRRQARRRKRHEAIAVIATAAVAAAGVIAVPKLISAFPGGSGPASAESSLQTAGGASGARQTTPHNQLTARPTARGIGPAVPSGFAPISATFVGLQTGWTLGVSTASCTAPGRSPAGRSPAGRGPAGQSAGSGSCLVLARTDNAGADWYGVPAPPTRLAHAGSGVSQVRFLNRDDGWVFAPELWWTADGGNTWQRADTGGRQVISLEAAGNRAFAVFATCASGPAGGGSGARGCYGYQLYSAAAGTGTWQPVPGATSGSGTASVVLARGTGYLLAWGAGQVSLARGAASGTAAWNAVTPPCPSAVPASPVPATATPAMAAGAPAALLAAGAPNQLFAVCAAGTEHAVSGSGTAGGQAKEIVASSDGGQSWHQSAIAPIGGTAWSAAATPDGSAMLIAASTGLYISRDGGTTWRQVLTGPPGGFGYAGMTDVLQGFAIPAARGHFGILFTTDGGQSWQASMVSGPP